MDIKIEKILIENKSILRNLLELYNYDFTEYGKEDIDEHGLYGYKYLDNYWIEEGRYPYLIRVDRKIAGFALVRTVNESSFTYFFMCEFFIMKKFRRIGVGKIVAMEIFDMHYGEWQVAQIEENTPAQDFWRYVINKYTNGDYKEIRKDDWVGPVQLFTSKKMID